MIDKGAQFPIYQELLHINRKKTSHYKDVQKGFGNTSKEKSKQITREYAAGSSASNF